MRPRIYTDTSVIGGCFDSEFEVPSRRLFRQFHQGEALLVISDLTLLELQGAPVKVRTLVKNIPEQYVEEVLFNSEAAELAERYVSSGIIGVSSYTDARHIATATVHHVTALVSWNFKHIVNLERIHEYNSVNVRLGYSMLEIRTPQEVISHDRE